MQVPLALTVLRAPEAGYYRREDQILNCNVKLFSNRGRTQRQKEEACLLKARNLVMSTAPQATSYLFALTTI